MVLPLKNSNGGVYIFKKTKEKSTTPWIRTLIYLNLLHKVHLKKYLGVPKQNDEKYKSYLKSRDKIVSKQIIENRNFLQTQLEKELITIEEYYDNLTSEKDYSQTFPFNPLT